MLEFTRKKHVETCITGKYGNPVLINADDFGLNHETNLAVIELLKTNRIQRTTLMVNMPFAQEAVQMAKDNHLESKIGLHINLTDGSPLSSAIKNTRFCSDGVFVTKQVESGARLYVKRSERRSIAEEVTAQFEKFKELMGYYPKHVDGHRHVHNYLGYLFSIIRISKIKGVESMRIGINLYDRQTAGLVKKVYKLVLNTIIKANFKHTDYMGAYLEYVDYYKASKDKSVEIMVHPTIMDGCVYDIIYDSDDKEFFDFDKICR